MHTEPTRCTAADNAVSTAACIPLWCAPLEEEGAAGEPPPAASGRLLYAAATGRSRQKSHSESGCQIPWHLEGVLAPCFYTCTAIDFFGLSINTHYGLIRSLRSTLYQNPDYHKSRRESLPRDAGELIIKFFAWKCHGLQLPGLKSANMCIDLSELGAAPAIKYKAVAKSYFPPALAPRLAVPLGMPLSVGTACWP